ncbi:DUF3037 domain-containing protein [Acidovorax temperans]|uniref:DUF3037 domain-containing protein n=1 Tax=Acidovorax temperans TaxID=80878 RepID=UPI00289C2E58|nr:DUF3037 domain-containing protein [Acidovorax temperans]
MKKLACQYALLRFRPFVETGEFANVGVVLLCPEGRFFGFKLLKKYGRITKFFHELDSKVYLTGKALFTEELDRFASHIRLSALDGRKRVVDVPLAVGLFAELTRTRDSMLQFDERRVVLADDPKAKLKELFDYYVERNFVTKAYQERLLESAVRRILFRDDPRIGAQYVQEKVGTSDFLVNFPFVHKTDNLVDRIIKPLFLGQDDSTRVLNHGGLWVDKLKRLRKRNALPENVLFPLAAPKPESKAYSAYEEIRQELVEVGVEVTQANNEKKILAFASEVAPSARH